MSKKILAFALALILLLCAGIAQAASGTQLDPYGNRNIKINKAGLNPVIEGESPTTGLPLSDYTEILADAGLTGSFQGLAVTGRYMPMLIQIDNADAGRGYRAPWGTEFVDVVYETPLYKAGDTRISFLYSNVIPDYVGPVRSARVQHAWLREEWDCGFCFYGQQEYTDTSVPAQFKKFGADDKGVLFSGTVGSGKPWKQYYTKRDGLQSPHDMGINPAAVSTLIPAAHTAANHTWLFTDDLPETDDEAYEIYVNWGRKDYASMLEYDEDDECYYRYLTEDGKNPELYVDLDNKKAITFSNVIIQFIEGAFPMTDAPNPNVTGTGNADYFMGGYHYQGVWNRDSIQERTVFYDENGDEIKLLRGRTLIITLDANIEGRSAYYE